MKNRDVEINEFEHKIESEIVFMFKIAYNTCNWIYMVMSTGFLIWKIILSARIIRCANYELKIQEGNGEFDEETSEEECKPKKRRKMKKKKKNKKRGKFVDTQDIEFVDKPCKNCDCGNKNYVQFDDDENRR